MCASGVGTHRISHTEKLAGPKTLNPPVHSPKGTQEAAQEEGANYIFFLLNMCLAQKQCTQAPGDINILIQVSHTDDGSWLPLSWNANNWR